MIHISILTKAYTSSYPDFKLYSVFCIDLITVCDIVNTHASIFAQLVMFTPLHDLYCIQCVFFRVDALPSVNAKTTLSHLDVSWVEPILSREQKVLLIDRTKFFL